MVNESCKMWTTVIFPIAYTFSSILGLAIPQDRGTYVGLKDMYKAEATLYLGSSGTDGNSHGMRWFVFGY